MNLTRSTTDRLDWSSKLLPYGVAIAGVAMATWLLCQLPATHHVAINLFGYLMVVIGMALYFGSGPAIVTSLLAYAAYAWFFGAPLYDLSVRDPGEWLALVMFLLTAVVTGQLMAMLRAHADEARRRAHEAAALADVSWSIAAQIDQEQALSVALHRLVDILGAQFAAVVVGEDAGLRLVTAYGSNDQSLPDLTDAAFKQVLASGQPIGWQEYWCQSAGATGSGEASMAAYLPLQVEHRVLGVLFLKLDLSRSPMLTERRVAESLANLAAVIMERERLARATKDVQVLAEADRLKTALLSMVSHDFRSPLASIKASVSSLLQDGSPLAPGAQRELLEGVDQEVDRLNHLVGHILNLSRLEAGAWRPNLEPIPPVELIGSALTPFGAGAYQRIVTRVDANLAEAWVDAVQMAQVIHNLVDNALKFSAPDGIVELDARTVDDRLVMTIADRGPGLEPGDEERIFERFYRAPKLRESNVPGVGLGLAVCKGLVEAHAGSLVAERREGGGSLFRIELPLLPRATLAGHKATGAWT